ncbi:hypothetical protein N9X26_03045 [Candidatus Actinomarina sp.]|nr:hypothetical protein [Candidatus Actinomarina sp.]
MSSINFIKKADSVFTASLNKEDLESFGFTNIEILETKNELITFLNLSLTIEENDVIYSHTDHVESLFKILETLKFKNIKIITSQSDRKITKKLFNKKPNCISEWYSINVHFKNKALIPIPLGLAPYRNTKSVILNDFYDLKYDNVKDQLIYANFNINTNYFHRSRASSYYIKNYKKKLVSQKNYAEYLKNLKKYKFALCPWGNGIDTHRFWEALYCGVIPITKKHYLYESFSGLPMVLVKSYKLLNKIEKNTNYESFDLIKLNMKYWIEVIQRTKVLSDLQEINIELNNNDIKDVQKKYLKLKFKNAVRKKFLTTSRKILTILN